MLRNVPSKFTYSKSHLIFRDEKPEKEAKGVIQIFIATEMTKKNPP